MCLCSVYMQDDLVIIHFHTSSWAIIVVFRLSSVAYRKKPYCFLVKPTATSLITINNHYIQSDQLQNKASDIKISKPYT